MVCIRYFIYCKGPIMKSTNILVIVPYGFRHTFYGDDFYNKILPYFRADESVFKGNPCIISITEKYYNTTDTGKIVPLVLNTIDIIEHSGIGAIIFVDDLCYKGNITELQKLNVPLSLIFPKGINTRGSAKDDVLKYQKDILNKKFNGSFDDIDAQPIRNPNGKFYVPYQIKINSVITLWNRLYKEE